MKRMPPAGAGERSDAAAGPRVPEPGQEVMYAGGPATVVRVIPPGGPDAKVDLVRYEGPIPKALGGIPRDPTSASGWAWASEVPPPPPTPEQRIEAARAAGQRVPRVGDAILYVVDGVDHKYQHLHTHRARVKAIRSPKEIDLETYSSPEPPEDPFEPDRIGATRFAVGHGLIPNGWIYPDEWVDKGPVDRDSLRVWPKCTRCGEPVVGGERLPLFARYGRRRLTPDVEFASLCMPCMEAVLEFAAGKPEPAIPA